VRAAWRPARDEEHARFLPRARSLRTVAASPRRDVAPDTHAPRPHTLLVTSPDQRPGAEGRTPKARPPASGASASRWSRASRAGPRRTGSMGPGRPRGPGAVSTASVRRSRGLRQPRSSGDSSTSPSLEGTAGGDRGDGTVRIDALSLGRHAGGSHSRTSRQAPDVDQPDARLETPRGMSALVHDEVAGGARCGHQGHAGPPRGKPVLSRPSASRTMARRARSRSAMACGLPSHPTVASRHGGGGLSEVGRHARVGGGTQRHDCWLSWRARSDHSNTDLGPA
jgi:hypothetical protein